MGASRRSVAPRVLHNPLAQRQEEGGNDWKMVFQWLEKMERIFQ